MIEKLAYIAALSEAVIAIDSEGWANWSAGHSGDPYFTQIHARLLVLMAYYKQSTIDAACQYMVAENKVPAAQTVPSAMYWPYKQTARFSDSRGVIQKRVPAHLVKPHSAMLHGAPGSHRYGTYEIFRKCQECLKVQPPINGEGNKLWGPMGRDLWYAEAESTGLFWLNYFNQQTLDWMYGPGKPNKWPFTFRCPPWCVENQYYWGLSAYDWNEYATLNIVYFPHPGGSYGSGITAYIMIEPDDSNGNPGNMEVGHLYSEHASMNTDYEVNGEYSDLTVSPLPAAWTPMDLSVTQHEDDPWLYQVLNFREMEGDYFINLFVSNELNFDEPYDLYYEELGGEWY